ncbi:MAG: hypothetical protein K9M14_01735 [Candidatus Omnitrophica bacterium]|nr:hypothetical protein [Candidatus Omnitrophota bacterium]
MDDNLYQDFVKSFNVALTNCSVYFPTHPIFSQSISQFKEKIKSLDKEKSFLLIEVKPDSLIVNRKNLKDKAIYRNLAVSLHRKKIKRIKIKKEITFQDLSDFLTSVALSEKDILAKGGIKKILKNKGAKNIEIEELDYSQLIKGKGKEVKDVWGYLLNSKNIQGGDQDSPDKFIDNFQETARKYGAKEVLEDDQLSQQLLELLSKLKIKDKEDFKKALKSLAQSILGDDGLDNLKNKESLKNLFSYLDSQDLANVLSKLLQSKQAIDPSSFKLFSALISPEIHKKAADRLGKEAEENREKFDMDKINNLFSIPDKEGIVPIYQKNLSVNIPAEIKEKNFSFDHKHLHQNYRLTLLDLFFYETNLRRLELILDKISAEIENNFSKNIEFLKKFAKIYKNKPAGIRSKDFNNKIRKIWAKAESNVFNIDFCDDLAFLADLLGSSTLGASFYLDKIKLKEFNPLVLKLFFKFFPKQINQLSEIIKDNRKDLNFFKKIIDSLETVDHPAALGIFKNLYNLAPFSAKIKILGILKNYSEYDEDFILSLAKSENFYLRKKVAEIAVNFPDLYRKIARIFLTRTNYFGINSETILENLNIIEESYRRQAKPFLIKLTKRKFFWNRRIRKKAREILESYYETKN